MSWLFRVLRNPSWAGIGVLVAIVALYYQIDFPNYPNIKGVWDCNYWNKDIGTYEATITIDHQSGAKFTGVDEITEAPQSDANVVKESMIDGNFVDSVAALEFERINASLTEDQSFNGYLSEDRSVMTGNFDAYSGVFRFRCTKI